MCLYEGSPESEEILAEEKQTKVITGTALLVVSSVRESVFDIVHWSSLTKAMQVVRWVLRLIKNAQWPSLDRNRIDLSFLSCVEPRLSYYAVFRSLNTVRSCVL